MFQCPADISGWVDEDFDVTCKGRNNPARAKTVTFQSSSGTFAWNGEFFFEVKNYSYGTVGKEVQMPFMAGTSGIGVDDIAQGDLGNCWFLASIIAATNREGTSEFKFATVRFQILATFLDDFGDEMSA